jgi:hypothetical protein
MGGSAANEAEGASGDENAGGHENARGDPAVGDEDAADSNG